MILGPDDYRFTFSEITGGGQDRFLAMNVRNWMARGTFEIGQKHKLGRWLFSSADYIRVRSITLSTALTGMPPADANKLADMIVDRYRYLVTRQGGGTFPILSDLKRSTEIGRCKMYLHPGTYGENGPKPLMAFTGEDGFPALKDDTSGFYNEWLRNLSSQAHGMIPVDDLIGAAYMRCTEMVFEEDGEDWPILEIGSPKSGEDPLAAHLEAQWSLNGMIAWFETFGHEAA